MHVTAVVLRVVLAVVAVVMVAATAMSAMKTVVVPRAVRTRLSSVTFGVIRRGFEMIGRRQSDYYARDRTMALFAPIALLTLPVLWLLIVMVGYAGAEYAVSPGHGAAGVAKAFEISGSYLLTLGTDAAPTIAGKLIGFTEAGLGLGLLALLITFLPSMYGAFARREALVGQLEVRANSPPSAVAMLTRYHVIGWLDRLDDQWAQWEQWFVDIEESHTSLGALSFFRSPHPDRSWVTAAGCVLDAAALADSTLDLGGRQAYAQLCLRSGYVTLRRIADFFGIEYDPDPEATGPISILRSEFDDAYMKLAKAGLPMRPDRDQCWLDFAGWRVNYDTVLLNLAALVFAPMAQWSSDRSPTFRPMPLLRGLKTR